MHLTKKCDPLSKEKTHLKKFFGAARYQMKTQMNVLHCESLKYDVCFLWQDSEKVIRNKLFLADLPLLPRVMVGYFVI